MSVERLKDCTYSKIVCNVRPEKEGPIKVRIAVGGNLINYPGDRGTPIADILTVKLLLNSIVSTPGAKFFKIDIFNFYLNTPLERKEYVRMELTDFHESVVEHYKLRDIGKYGWVYVEVSKGMYGLPQAGILAQKLLEERLNAAALDT